MKLKPTNLNIRASQAEKVMLEQVAQANNTTPSEMMRQLIRQAHAKLQENPMWIIYSTQFGQYAINEKEGKAARPGRMFDPPLVGAFYPDTKEIVWGTEQADWDSIDSIAVNSVTKQAEMFIADGHRQDSRFPSVAKSHPCKDADTASFWWNHWSEFNTLTHTNAVCYVAHNKT